MSNRGGRQRSDSSENDRIVDLEGLPKQARKTLVVTIATEDRLPAATVPLRAFSHLYVESGVWDHPRTREVRRAFPKAEVVEIDHYGQLTGRKSQLWSEQKRAPKLILARKINQMIYPCSDVAPNFGHENFYYVVPMQNCIYDCEYCYLQGMYTSAHLLLFVNQDDMQQVVRQQAAELGSLYLCIAYDNDLMAMESKLGLVRDWVEALRSTPTVTMEVRTKSANFRSLRDLEPAGNVILAWTLSPTSVVERFEAQTPPWRARLDSLRLASRAGWRVRLCLDPLLPVRDWRAAYSELFSELDRQQIWNDIEDASFGTFRMNKDYLRQARRVRPDSALIQGATVTTDSRGLHTLPHSDLPRLLEYVEQELVERMGAARVFAT